MQHSTSIVLIILTQTCKVLVGAAAFFSPAAIFSAPCRDSQRFFRAFCSVRLEIGCEIDCLAFTQPLSLATLLLLSAGGIICASGIFFLAGRKWKEISALSPLPCPLLPSPPLSPVWKIGHAGLEFWLPFRVWHYRNIHLI